MARKKRKKFRFWIIAILLFAFVALSISQIIERAEKLIAPAPPGHASLEKPKRSSPRPIPLPKRDQIAILIDDLGPNLKEFHQLRFLHPNLSFAVLPFQSFSVTIAREVRSEGNHDLLLHLPMEAESNRENPGKGAIYHSMTGEEIRRQTRLDIQAIPAVQGVNNHMGSRITSDPAEMRIILDEVKASRLYFVDSRTTPGSVAFSLAGEMGIRTAERQVFLDDSDRPEDIMKEFDRLARLAHQNGSAIAIGHPRTNTILAIKSFLPRMTREQLELVPVSLLVQ